MPSAIKMSAEQDAAILSMRAAGVSWPAIATVIGCHRNTVFNRARVLGVTARVVRARVLGVTARVVIVTPLADPGPRGFRPPLPAGHPDSWAAITAGTSLAGSPYL